jgi:uncharacterized protein (DUF1778 family)
MSPDEWLEVRLPLEQMNLLRRAAVLDERSLTDFIAVSAIAAAEATIERHTVVQLSPDDSRAFADALIHPDAPNEHLRIAAQRHRNLIGGG